MVILDTAFCAFWAFITVIEHLQGTDFIRGGAANDWVESFRPPGLPEFGGPETRFAEFEQIYNNAGSTFGPALDGKFLDLRIPVYWMTGCLSIHRMIPERSTL